MAVEGSAWLYHGCAAAPGGGVHAVVVIGFVLLSANCAGSSSENHGMDTVDRACMTSTGPQRGMRQATAVDRACMGN